MHLHRGPRSRSKSKQQRSQQQQRQHAPAVSVLLVTAATVVVVGCYLFINVTLLMTLDHYQSTTTTTIIVHHNQQERDHDVVHVGDDVYRRHHRRRSPSSSLEGRKSSSLRVVTKQEPQQRQQNTNKEQTNHRQSLNHNFLSSLLPLLLLRNNSNNNQQQQQQQLTSTPVTIKQRFDELYGGFDLERIHAVLDPQRMIPPQQRQHQQQQQPSTTTTTSTTTMANNNNKNNDMPYDIFNCPKEQPPPNYPVEWKALDVLEHWGIDQTVVPVDDENGENGGGHRMMMMMIHQGLCVFDWENIQDRPKVQVYRQAEVPFVLQNHPQVLQTAERWSTEGYLEELLPNDKLVRNEHAAGNHFMFWRLLNQHKNQKQLRTWQAPTEMVELSYKEWKQKALALEQIPDSEQAKVEHWYFRLNAARVGENQANDFLYDELPFFDASDGVSTLFMVEPQAERGINCRFGMKGVFAESHFDPTRNWITLLKGRRRYLLAHPKQCRNLQLYPMDHPSARHSQVDWSRPADDIKERPELAGFAE